MDIWIMMQAARPRHCVRTTSGQLQQQLILQCCISCYTRREVLLGDSWMKGVVISMVAWLPPTSRDVVAVPLYSCKCRECLPGVDAAAGIRLDSKHQGKFTGYISRQHVVVDDNVCWVKLRVESRWGEWLSKPAIPKPDTPVCHVDPPLPVFSCTLVWA